ncbi:hypothetical protein BUZ16_09655 [Staphylococcus haemolyticus]|uniref:uberolysin/carnocyclin family circular bacteriocin n=1 Tax=Staphylococcus haemolyticus TaxID=1283 RepID=UPI000D1F85B0|nr:uberolysin/carnocyclin family circular bacteriocin [Staphylococcus haemolyticus]PTK81855.1 hypothetical protein BUZ16_09655 [Staphylococcus haemolyticus]
MNATKTINSIIFLTALVAMSSIAFVLFSTVSPNLVSMLSIDSGTALVIVNRVLDTVNLATIVASVGTLTGAGAIGVGLLQTAKWLALKFGKKRAQAW